MTEPMPISDELLAELKERPWTVGNLAPALIARLEAVERERDELRDVLCFYADPESYFAIGFRPDPPCGEFIDDFSDCLHPDGHTVLPKPGRRARALLKAQTGMEFK